MSLEDNLRDKIKKMMADLEVVVGYKASNLPLKVNAAFIKDADEANDLIFNRLCINNLAAYAYSLAKGLKGNIGIVLKPCDIRSIVQLLSEELFDRERLEEHRCQAIAASLDDRMVRIVSERRYQDNRHWRVAVACRRENVITCGARHLDVGDH